MRYILFSLFVCCFAHPVVYAATEEEIVVRLSGDTPLLPLYLSPAAASDPLHTLREVLAFDLNNNGMTRVLSGQESASRQSLKGQESFDAPLDFQKLKVDNVFYLVKLQLKDNQLAAKVISVSNQTGHTIEAIALTGVANQDRKTIHKLADAIHKVLFGKEGIASCRILYCVKKKSGSTWVSEVFESDYDGHNIQQMTRDNSYCATPLYVPGSNGAKSSSFLYVSYKIGQPKIYASPRSVFQPTRVSSLRGNQVTPSMSRDQSLIAFACDTTGKADIFIQPFATGKPPQQIFAAKAAANASPTFSPNGKQIAFVSNKDGSPKIYLLDIPPPGKKLSDMRVTLLSKRCRENSAPVWSPDGKKLAYCSRTSGPRQIWIYDFETKTERQLTDGSSDKENPSWASNSLHLLFNATDSHGTQLYMLNLNQPKAVAITAGPGAKQFPCWEPKNL